MSPSVVDKWDNKSGRKKKNTLKNNKELINSSVFCFAGLEIQTLLFAVLTKKKDFDQTNVVETSNGTYYNNNHTGYIIFLWNNRK